MDWISIETRKPRVGEWVLVWDNSTQFASMAKWTGTVWRLSVGNMSTKRGSHWIKVRGPANQPNEQQYKSSLYTSRESQNT
jgi:hypothetical protein